MDVMSVGMDVQIWIDPNKNCKQIKKNQKLLDVIL